MQVNELVVVRDSGVTATLSIAQAIIAMLRLRAFALSVLGDDGSPIGVLSEGDLKEHLELDIEKRRPRWAGVSIPR
jgi:CBS domain-containing protein